MIKLFTLLTLTALCFSCTTNIKVANNRSRMSFREPGVMTFGKRHRFHIKKYPTAFISKYNMDKTRKLLMCILVRNGYRLDDHDSQSIHTKEKILNYEERFVAVKRHCLNGYYYLPKEDACSMGNRWFSVIYYGRISLKLLTGPEGVKVLMYGFIRKEVPFVTKAECNDMPNLNPSIPLQGHPMLWKIRTEIMATKKFMCVHHYKD